MSGIPHSVTDYYVVKDSLSICEGLVTLGCRIVIPQSMRQAMLERIHDGHQNLSKCRERAQETVWWPKISDDIKQRVETCHFCQTNKDTQCKEPLQPTPLPECPWQKLATDLCEYKSKHYCVVSDYYSRYLEILQLTSTLTEQIIKVLKAAFAQFGALEQIQSDNGSCYTSEAWKDFCRQ